MWVASTNYASEKNSAAQNMLFYSENILQQLPVNYTAWILIKTLIFVVQ